MSFCTSLSSNLRPMRRFTAKSVFFALVTAWRLAGAPTRMSASSVYATIEGVVREPSEFSITLGLPPSMIATQEFVVPRSMPMILAIALSLVRIQVTVRIGVSGRVFNRFGDRHQSGAQHPVVQPVALLHDRDDPVRLEVGIDRRHRLVRMGVEALAGRRVDLADAGFFERSLELAGGELDRAQVLRRNGGFEAVDDRQEPQRQALDAVLVSGADVGLGALAHVLGLGDRTHPGVLLLVEPALRLGEELVEGLVLGRNRLVGVGLGVVCRHEKSMSWGDIGNFKRGAAKSRPAPGSNPGPH